MAEEKKIIATSVLPGPIELAKEAWEIYKARFWIVIGIGFFGYLAIALIMLVAVILGAVAFFALGGKVDVSIVVIGAILGILAVVGMIAVGTWISGAIIISINDWKKKIGIKESYNLAKPFIVSLFLTSLLSFLINFGSLFVFVIPAFIFAVWFAFSQYAVLIDKQSGLRALHTSREYVRGRFWGVIWRMIAVHLPEVVLSIAITSGTSANGNGEINGLSGLFHLVTLLAVPFYLMYTYVLFMHLRKTSETKVASVPRNSKLLYVLVPLIGYALIIFAALAIIPVASKSMGSFANILNESKNTGSIGDGTKPGTQIIAGLVAYRIAHGSFPKDMNVLVTEKILPEVPTDPATGSLYVYSVSPDGEDFKLCTPEDVTPQKCVTSKSTNFDL